MFPILVPKFLRTSLVERPAWGTGIPLQLLMLSPALLDALRAYWLGLKRKASTWLYTASHPIDTKVLWLACRHSTERAGLEHKHIHPHTLRHASTYHTTFQSLFILKTIRRQSRAAMDCVRLGLHSWQFPVFSIDDQWSEVDNLRCRKNLLPNEPFDNGIAAEAKLAGFVEEGGFGALAGALSVL